MRGYFESFLGYWERRAEQLEERLIRENFEERARIRAYEQLCAEMEVKKKLDGLPSLEKWAKKVGVHPSTVSRWRQEHEEFDAACADCLVIQSDILRDGGLSGIYNGKIAAFLIERNEQRAHDLSRLRDDADERSQVFTQMEDFEDD